MLRIDRRRRIPGRVAGFVFSLIAVLSVPAIAQDAPAARRAPEGRVYRDRVQPNWFAGNSHFWYRVATGPERHEFVLVDAEKGTRQPACDHRRLADALVKAGVKDARAERLPIDRLDFQLAEQTLTFRCANQTWRCNLKTYDVAKPEAPAKETAGTRAESDATLLQPVAGGPKASTGTGPETSVTFVNRTSAAVELFWLDPQGARRGYGKLRAGDERDQHTFTGHVWLAVDDKGKPLGLYQAGEQPATVEITGKTAPRSTRDGRRDKPDQPRQRDRRSGQGGNSPDGRWQAFFKDHNVWAKDTAGGQEFALSTDGTAKDAYGGGLFWSPDSKKLVAVRTKKADEREIHFIESSPRDQVQPKLHTISYNKPGDVLPIDKPQLFDVAGKRHVTVSDALFDNPFSIRDIRWARDSGRFTFVYNQRGHQALRLLAVEAESGSVRPIIDEKSDTFIDYSGKYFLHYLDETDELIWMSERDGWNHLYLYDARTGKVKNQITKGPWVVRGVDRIDEAARQVWFRAGGVRAGQDPYYIHYCRVHFDGSDLTVLTEGDGTHQIEFSPDRRFLLDRYSRVDLPPVTELRRTADGRLVCALERADASELLKTGWQPPEPFVAKGRDAATDIYGMICRPKNLDPAKKYPVVEEIYAGPQGSFVPKSFSTGVPGQSLTDLGFIVVKIDGMGTSNRSKKFHDVCWKNLADAGFPDRIAWMKAAAAKYPYMDLSRVGIYGGSAGGQNAACAVMTHGDFYKVAVADCGCHDNRMDKLWWNEQWMGWPVGPHYAANSNVTLARGLKGKLLLIVGEMDTNVDPASTMQVVNALIKADKDFDMLVVPGAGHGAAGTPYAARRQRDYFVRHLMGTEPKR